ncbi:MAG TPA: AgmX/PglI C-terminal domain-containing protein [Candidatus Polarisedimenticolia bacterium]|nr:AgmX/PglI C-terminal domain-containing protein [Candidatus Polarisedimenticolia bacterium]
MKSQEELKLGAQVDQARERLEGLTTDLRVVDDEAERLAPQRIQHELLAQACGSLEKLGEIGAASLFWGDRVEPARVAEQLRRIRGLVSAFQARLDALDARRGTLLAEIGRRKESLAILGEDLYDVREAEERRKHEWVVEREISPVPRHVQLMAWARGGEEDRFFYKTLAATMLVGSLLGAWLPMIALPLPDPFVPDNMPRRLVQFIRQEQAKPVPPPPVVAEKPPEQKPPEPREPKPAKQPKPAEQPGQPQAKSPGTAVAESRPGQGVGKAGILAFRDKFASLAQDKVTPQLGAGARYRNADDASRASTRSMLTTNAPGSSGGINLGALSLGVGGGGGGGGGGGAIQGVQIGRATSSIAGIGGGDRPLARGGPGASRTDEEIQIVFDRYKARFYRLYNEELRRDPSLRGQMVLRLTIEPDGSVSMCRLQSSDMHAPDLAVQVVDIVRTINFGAKEGVRALTIVYPIDFLPAS